MSYITGEFTQPQGFTTLTGEVSTPVLISFKRERGKGIFTIERKDSIRIDRDNPLRP